MKTTTAAMDTALASVSVRLARCYYIERRDATTYRFTDHDEQLVISGLTGTEAILNGTYLPVESPNPSQLDADLDLNVDNMEIQGPMALRIDPDDIDGGAFDGATIYIFAVDWGNLSAGILRLRRGSIGEIKRFDNQYLFEVRGATQPLFQEVVSVYTAFCAADLGDDRCKIQLQPEVWAGTTAYVQRVDKDAMTEQETPAGVVRRTNFNDRQFVCTTAGTSGGSEPMWNLVIGGTTNDGTVVWTTRRSNQHRGGIASVTSQREFVIVLPTDSPDGYYDLGHVQFEDGLNVGLVLEIKSWVLSTKTIIMSLPFPFTVEVGDEFLIYAGCNKTKAACKVVFDNIRNYRGFPDVPGQDEAFRTPDDPGS